MVERLLIVAALAALAGCATQEERDETELLRLLDWFPGRYSNVEQAESDVREGRVPHTALELNVVRIYAPRIGENVFYVQETAADDPLRVLAQRLVAFEAVEDLGLLQTLWTLKEPLRWRDAHQNIDLFKSMVEDDYTRLAGCDLVWKGEPERFTGANKRDTCRVTSPITGSMVRMEFRAELSPDGLALSDQSFDVAGRPVQDNFADPYYRFIRR